MTVRLLLAALGVVLLSGCAQQIAGTASPAPDATDPTAVPAPDAELPGELGDFVGPWEGTYTCPQGETGIPDLSFVGRVG